jgi:acetyl esterase/lipase
MLRLLSRWSAALLVALLSGACSRLALLDAFTPKGAMTVARDIALGDDPRQSLDVYTPNARPPRPRPIIVWFYGGSWQSGRKAHYRFIAEWLTGLGYVVAIPDYRLYPKVRFPAFLEDGAKALAWLADEKNVAPLAGDARCLILMGHSAGAYNAAMLAHDRRWADAAGVPAGAVKGFIGLAGPYDFHPYDVPSTKATFGDAPPEETQPVRHAQAGGPATLLLHGRADTTVDPRHVEALAQVLRRVGVPVETHMFDGVDHVRIVSALSTPLKRGDIRAPIAGFLARVEKTQCRT